MPKKGERNNLVGKRFGRLVVKSIDSEIYDKKGRFQAYKYLCKCDCGKSKVILSGSLKSGRTKSCGCLRYEELLRRNTKHGLSGTDLFIKYHHMKARCTNPKASHYNRYGGRGIKVCDEWFGDKGFDNFVTWSLENGYKEGLSLDRINNDGDYEPNNCRWVLFREQSFNRNNTIFINGESIAKKAYEHGLNLKTVYRRIKSGWDIEDLYIPVGTKRKKHGKNSTKADQS